MMKMQVYLGRAIRSQGLECLFVVLFSPGFGGILRFHLLVKSAGESGALAPAVEVSFRVYSVLMKEDSSSSS